MQGQGQKMAETQDQGQDEKQEKGGTDAEKNGRQERVLLEFRDGQSLMGRWAEKKVTGQIKMPEWMAREFRVYRGFPLENFPAGQVIP